jgi:hypothetical protein
MTQSLGGGEVEVGGRALTVEEANQRLGELDERLRRVETASRRRTGRPEPPEPPEPARPSEGEAPAPGARPRVAGGWLEYAPAQWVRASAVVAIEATPDGSSVRLVATEPPARRGERHSPYVVDVLVAALAEGTAERRPERPPRASAPRPARRPATT